MFAQFLNTDPETTKLFATQQFLFPATRSLLADPSFTGDEPDFYGGQRVNQVFADIGATVPADFQWPPFLDHVATDWTDTVGASLGRGTDTVAALATLQSRLSAYARKQGFTVKEA